jgi:hypothetical protein
MGAPFFCLAYHNFNHYYKENKMKPNPTLKEGYDERLNKRKEALLRTKYCNSRDRFEDASRKINKLERERKLSLKWMEFFDSVDMEECFLDDEDALRFTPEALKRAPIER